MEHRAVLHLVFDDSLADPRLASLGRTRGNEAIITRIAEEMRCVAELFAELFGRSFLPFPHFAVVNHHIMRVARSLALDLAKSDQSSFISQYSAGSTSKARNRELFDN